MSIAMPVSPRQAAARLGLSVGRVRQLIGTGALRAVNVGLDRPVWAIDETELERFVALTRPAHRPRKEPRMKKCYAAFPHLAIREASHDRTGRPGDVHIVDQDGQDWHILLTNETEWYLVGDAGCFFGSQAQCDNRRNVRRDGAYEVARIHGEHAQCGVGLTFGRARNGGRIAWSDLPDHIKDFARAFALAWS